MMTVKTRGSVRRPLMVTLLLLLITCWASCGADVIECYKAFLHDVATEVSSDVYRDATNAAPTGVATDVANVTGDVASTCASARRNFVKCLLEKSGMNNSEDNNGELHLSRSDLIDTLLNCRIVAQTASERKSNNGFSSNSCSEVQEELLKLSYSVDAVYSLVMQHTYWVDTVFFYSSVSVVLFLITKWPPARPALLIMVCVIIGTLVAEKTCCYVTMSIFGSNSGHSAVTIVRWTVRYVGLAIACFYMIKSIITQLALEPHTVNMDGGGSGSSRHSKTVTVQTSSCLMQEVSVLTPRFKLSAARVCRPFRTDRVLLRVPPEFIQPTTDEPSSEEEFLTREQMINLISLLSGNESQRRQTRLSSDDDGTVSLASDSDTASNLLYAEVLAQRSLNSNTDDGDEDYEPPSDDLGLLDRRSTDSNNDDDCEVSQTEVDELLKDQTTCLGDTRQLGDFNLSYSDSVLQRKDETF